MKKLYNFSLRENKSVSFGTRLMKRRNAKSYAKSYGLNIKKRK